MLSKAFQRIIRTFHTANILPESIVLSQSEQRSKHLPILDLGVVAQIGTALTILASTHHTQPFLIQSCTIYYSKRHNYCSLAMDGWYFSGRMLKSAFFEE